MKKAFFASVAVVTTVIGLCPVAFAGTISATTAINFTCGGEGVAGPGKTSLPIGGGCTPYHTGSGASLKTYEGLTSFGSLGKWFQQSDSGNSTYEVQSISGVSVNPGNPYKSASKPGNGKFSTTSGLLSYNATNGFNYSAGQTSATVSTLTSKTNIVPTLISSNTGGIKQLEISSGSLFMFDGFFFGETSADTTLSYMIFGYDGSNLVYCIDSAGNSCSGNLSNDWDTYTPSGSVSANQAYYTLLSLPGGDAGKIVTTVYIDTKVPSGKVQYLDNFLVTETPEPDSLILLGTGFGLVGLMLFLRRRHTARQSTAA